MSNQPVVYDFLNGEDPCIKELINLLREHNICGDVCTEDCGKDGIICPSLEEFLKHLGPLVNSINAARGNINLQNNTGIRYKLLMLMQKKKKINLKIILEYEFLKCQCLTKLLDL